MGASTEPSARRPRAARLAPYLLVCLAWAATTAAATHLHADSGLHTAALFAHLGCLALGFGAVLSVDFHALMWLLGRTSLRQVTGLATQLHHAAWVGLAGLVLTGALLEPDASAPLTQLKLAMVLVLGLNGVYATSLSTRLAGHRDDHPPTRLLLRAACSTLVSQVCWWGAMAIGFLNTRR